MTKKTNSTTKFKDHNLFFLVVTCQKYLDRAKAVENTWLRQTNNHLIALCDETLNEPVLKEGYLWLPGDDSYLGAPRKEALAYQFVRDNYDFDYLIKTDDDTFVHIPRLMEESFPDRAFFGSSKIVSPTWRHPHGSFLGIGKDLLTDNLLKCMRLPYTRLMELTVQVLPELVESVAIKSMKHGDVRLAYSMMLVHRIVGWMLSPARFDYSGHSFPYPDNDIICGHYISPKLMYRLGKLAMLDELSRT